MGQEQTMHVAHELSLLETNAIQMAMIQASGLSPREWITRHAVGFREIVTNNPHIVSLYRENPEDAIRTIEERLRVGDTPQASA